MLYVIEEDENGWFHVYSNDGNDMLTNLTPDGFATYEEAENWMDTQTKGPLRPFRYYED